MTQERDWRSSLPRNTPMNPDFCINGHDKKLFWRLHKTNINKSGKKSGYCRACSRINAGVPPERAVTVPFLQRDYSEARRNDPNCLRGHPKALYWRKSPTSRNSAFCIVCSRLASGMPLERALSTERLNRVGNITPEVARLGGLMISKNKAHMSAIGKLGGTKVSQDREHMSRIGKIPRKETVE